MEENYLQDLDESLGIFNSYFPHERDDTDIVILRGHQLAESLLYRFVRQNVQNPKFIDSFFIRWEPLLSLVRAMKQGNEEEYIWVWSSLMKLERARNQIAHNLETDIFDQKVTDFVNCVRSQVPDFKSIPGTDNLKKSIFVVYCGLSTSLALEKYPACGATYIVRDMIKEHGQSIIPKLSDSFLKIYMTY